MFDYRIDAVDAWNASDDAQITVHVVVRIARGKIIGQGGRFKRREDAIEWADRWRDEMNGSERACAVSF